jgi:exopolysaccharide biosynthesis polyprenyl glycosylphosphotransferase
MLRQFSNRRIVGFFLFDWLATLGVLVLALQVRVWIGILPPNLVAFIQGAGISVNQWPIYTASALLIPQLLVLVAVVWPFFLVVFNVYDGRHNSTLRSELLNVFTAIIAATLVLAGLLYFTYQEVSRVAFLVFFVLDCALLLGMRLAWWLFRRHTQVTRTSHQTIIIGAGPVGRRVAEELRKYAEGRVELIGFVDDDPDKQNRVFGPIGVLGTLDDLPSIIAANCIVDAVVALPMHAHSRLIEVCHTLQQAGVHVHVVPDLFILSFPSAALDGFGGIPVLDLGQPGIHGLQRIFKRTFDVLVTSVTMLFIWPIMAAIAVAIKLDSPGPVLYRQTRIGERGQVFSMLKFRSMRVDGDDSIHRAYVKKLIQENTSLSNGAGTLKMTDDPRITRVGKFIRKTSLDELPQFINVIRGEMSLVGPRPPIPYEVEVYQEWHTRRFEAIPGITGMWQVYGRNRVSFDEMVRMDIDYIERQSLWLDLKLLVQTPLVLLTGRGAG